MYNTTTFNGRFALTELISNELPKIFNSEEYDIVPFGVETLIEKSLFLGRYIQSALVNNSQTGMMVKFLPDYLLIKKKYPQAIYFLEVKATVTPIWSSKNFNEIKEKNKDIRRSDVGIIAREAWSAYKSFFPNTIIIAGCSYNPKLLMAQTVDKIECLRCYGTSSTAGYTCENCPVKNKGFFNYARNFLSSGSQTPHTNLNYNTFMTIEDFFSSIDIAINMQMVECLKERIKSIGVRLDDKIFSSVKENITRELINEGCYWLKQP